MNATQFLPFPTRIVPSGTQSVAPNEAAGFSGIHSRQLRVQFTVTNLSASGRLKLITPNGGIFGTVEPLQTLGYATSAEFMVANPTEGAIDFEVCELYPDLDPRNSGSGSPSGNAGQSAGFGSGGATSGSGGRGNNRTFVTRGSY